MGDDGSVTLDLPASALLVAGALALLLLARWRRPVAWLVGGRVSATTLTYLVARYPFGPVVLSLVVVLVVAVARGDRLTGWLVASTV